MHEIFCVSTEWFYCKGGVEMVCVVEVKLQLFSISSVWSEWTKHFRYKSVQRPTDNLKLLDSVERLQDFLLQNSNPTHLVFTAWCQWWRPGQSRGGAGPLPSAPCSLGGGKTKRNERNIHGHWIPFTCCRRLKIKTNLFVSVMLFYTTVSLRHLTSMTIIYF